MTKEELVEFIRQNLSITITKRNDSFCSGQKVEVELILENEVISKDNFYLD